MPNVGGAAQANPEFGYVGRGKPCSAKDAVKSGRLVLSTGSEDVGATRLSTSACNSGGVVTTVKMGASGQLGTHMVLAPMVPGLERNVAELCTGQP